LINFVNRKYIESFDEKQSPELIFANYLESCNEMDTLAIEQYKRMDRGWGKSESANRLYKNLIDFRNNFGKFDRLINSIVKEDICDIFNKKTNFEELKLDGFQINFILGWDLCEGCLSVVDDVIHVNILLEKYMDVENLQMAIEVTIIHELLHGYRDIKNKLSNDQRMGDQIIEEGLACMYCAEIYKPSKVFSELILPNGISLINSDTMKTHADKFKMSFNRKCDKYTRKLVYLGHKRLDIPNGIGYYYGILSIMDLIVNKKLKIEELVMMDSGKIKAHINAFEGLNFDYEKLEMQWRHQNGES